MVSGSLGGILSKSVNDQRFLFDVGRVFAPGPRDFGNFESDDFEIGECASVFLTGVGRC